MSFRTRFAFILLLVFSVVACGGKQNADDVQKKTFKERQEALDRRVEKIRDDALKDLGTIEKQLNKIGTKVQTNLSKAPDANDKHYRQVQSLKDELDTLAEEVQRLTAETEEELETVSDELGDKVKSLDKKTKELSGENADPPESAPTEEETKE